MKISFYVNDYHQIKKLNLLAVKDDNDCKFNNKNILKVDLCEKKIIIISVHLLIKQKFI